MAMDEGMNDRSTEEEKLRRWGKVDALMDCLALLEQEGSAGGAAKQQAAMSQAVEYWLDETSGSQTALDAGREDGYRACAEWLAQGPAREALAAQLIEGVFAVWPRDAGDYRWGYDAFLEKELQNPRAPYYSSSHVWITAVDDLRTKVTCAHEQGQVLSHRIVRRAVKLLHMHPEHVAAYLTRAAPPAGSRGPQSTSSEAVARHRGSPFGAGLWRRLRQRR